MMIALHEPARRRTATLIVRAWTEADGVIRARLLAVECDRTESTWGAAAGVLAITDAVRRWLDETPWESEDDPGRPAGPGEPGGADDLACLTDPARPADPGEPGG